MSQVEAALDAAGLENPAVREYVAHWAAHTGATRVEVVSAADDARLIAEALEAGEILPAGEGRYYSRSYYKDTARSEERTIVATNSESDRGTYNNWRPASEMKPLLEGLMKDALVGKTMYVIPYLMAPPGSPLERFAAGVEITDNRTVVLHMIRMARVGVDLIDNLADPDSFVRAVHVTGDLEKGYAPEAPYDVIFVHGAVEFVPQALFDQLRDGGRLVVVEGYGNASQARLYIKEGGLASERYAFNTSVKPLPGFRKAREFVF